MRSTWGALAQCPLGSPTTPRSISCLYATAATATASGKPTRKMSNCDLVKEVEPPPTPASLLTTDWTRYKVNSS
ncbi:hypothetical protein LSAT2_000256 [Lamellibrachia satsuma]|nr:hypothetical protein LSAT2_000256 [Lamellibrachia satsuma]